MTVAANFTIPYLQYLNENSQLDASVVTPDVSQLLHLYYLMNLIRIFDNKAIALQRTGKIGTYPSTRGQEAVFVGIGHAMEKTDVFLPYYRDIGVLIQRGVTLAEILAFWGGDERGNNFACASQDFPYCVPIAGQVLHAAGVAMAIKYKQEKRAVLTTCGDGATSKGDFYEAINAAGVWQLPVVFVISNNQWAISVPRAQQSAAQTLAQKAISAGIKGIQVDGNDIIAVEHTIKTALFDARENSQPCVIEVLCYRHSSHTTADDATRYEPQGLQEQEWKKEPIARLRVYLENLSTWSTEQEQALQQQCSQEVEAAVAEYLAMPPQPPTAMFDYLYAELPEAYAGQREEVSQREGLDHG